jgi:7-cyano-7-deazaguanine synthase
VLATGRRVRIQKPLGRAAKATLLKRYRHLPLGLTFSCARPVGLLHCGRCNKCAERRLAFAQAGLDDPTRYAAPADPRQK